MRKVGKIDRKLSKKKFFFLSLEDWDEPSLEMKSLCDYGDTNHSLLEQNNEERDFLL